MPAGQRLLHADLGADGADSQSLRASAVQGPPKPTFVGSSLVVTDHLQRGAAPGEGEVGSTISAAAAGQNSGVILAVRLKGGKVRLQFTCN